MTRLLKAGLPALGLAVFGVFAATTPAAACTITGVQAISGLNASLGTYSVNNGLSAAMDLAVTVNKSGTGACPTLRLAFEDTMTPSVMTGPGSTTLGYTIQTASSVGLIAPGNGGNSFLDLPAPDAGTTDSLGAYTVNVSAVIVVASGQSDLPTGTYSNASSGLKAVVFESSTPFANQPPVTISATVFTPRSCTIGGSANPSSGRAVIPISGSDVASITPILPVLSGGDQVSCTGMGPVAITLRSRNDRLTTGTNAATTDFADTIDYKARASVSGGTAATYDSTSRTAVAGLSGSTPSSLLIEIMPMDPVKPLIPGTYRDTLTIELIPN
jgi:hypothetical protein